MRALAYVLVASACGRVGFDALATHDGAADVPPAGAVSWVKVFVGQSVTTGTLTDSWTVAAANAGDAIVIHVFCESTVQPTAYSITANGWTFAPLSPITGMSGGTFWDASVGAIAPDTLPTTFTVTWSGTASCTFVDELGDEFTGNDPTGGTVTFGSHAETAVMGDCTASLTTPDAGDALWAACTTNCVSAAGAGFTKGADDGHCDWSEHREGADPAGTPETVTFATTNQAAYVMTAATIKPH